MHMLWRTRTLAHDTCTYLTYVTARPSLSNHAHHPSDRPRCSNLRQVRYRSCGQRLWHPCTASHGMFSKYLPNPNHQYTFSMFNGEERHHHPPADVRGTVFGAKYKCTNNSCALWAYQLPSVPHPYSNRIYFQIKTPLCSVPQRGVPFLRSRCAHTSPALQRKRSSDSPS